MSSDSKVHHTLQLCHRCSALFYRRTLWRWGLWPPWLSINRIQVSRLRAAATLAMWSADWMYCHVLPEIMPLLWPCQLSNSFVIRFHVISLDIVKSLNGLTVWNKKSRKQCNSSCWCRSSGCGPDSGRTWCWCCQTWFFKYFARCMPCRFVTLPDGCRNGIECVLTFIFLLCTLHHLAFLWLNLCLIFVAPCYHARHSTPLLNSGQGTFCHNEEHQTDPNSAQRPPKGVRSGYKKSVNQVGHGSCK